MAYKKLKYWFDKELAILIADKCLVIDKSFPKKVFISKVDKTTKALELKDRVEAIADELNIAFSGTYSQNVAIIKKILGPENKEETGMFTNYYWVMPLAKYIEKYGLNHFKTSMKAIEEITKRNTGEYAIRPFLAMYPEKALDQLLVWSKHKNFHVRRLASEGPRPRLPWASKLQQFIENPKPLLPILTNLKDDKSKYVQKSVANCLNDILKDNKKIATEVIESWIPNMTKERKWIIKHALKNLKKKEDDWAMSIINQLDKISL